MIAYNPSFQDKDAAILDISHLHLALIRKQVGTT